MIAHVTCGLAIFASTLMAQSPSHTPTCPASEAHRFDFLVGNWHGQEYLITSPTDSTRDDDLVARNRKLPVGCAFEESWEFTPRDGGAPVRAVIVRAFDLPTNTWRYANASNYVELAVFDGARTDSGWAFTHTLTSTTPPRLLRFQWMPTPSGYTEILQVSSDSGRTWPVVRHMNYIPDNPAACAAPEYHQFDFWIGDWTVTGKNGQVVGTNTIDRPLGSCVLQEHWIGTSGSHGSSFNVYDATRKHWHQTWVDDQGTLLVLNGSFADGKMTLTGLSAKTLNRIVWSRESGDPNKVRQVWDASTDGGKTWQNVFNGLYSRM